MNQRILENGTLSFSNEGFARGAVEETFYPWDETIARWEREGLPPDFLKTVKFPDVPSDILYYYRDKPISPVERFYHVMMTEAVYDHEQRLGLDPVKRMAFRIPFQCFEEELREDAPTYFIRRDRDGWVRKYHKNSPLVEGLTPVISCEEDWARLKEKTKAALAAHCTRENALKFYGRYSEGCKNGDFVIRFRLNGFFWTPRDLFGVEEHLMAFYDYPALLHDINRFILDTYLAQMDIILDIITPNIILLEEDLSGKDGPMISPACFDEFVGAYYREVVPFLKSRRVSHVFVDTDGDFRTLIPNFIKFGIDSFLPLDVNAGVDIVALRAQFPDIKLLGGFDKLQIQDGPQAIDREFERLLPVIRGGGYLPSCDHQPAPSTSLENYKYYLKRLREVMTEHRGEGRA